MISGTSLSTTATRIAQHYKVSNNFLGSALKKIASGKEIQQPRDNIPDFFRSQNLKRNVTDLRRVESALAEGQEMIRVAEQAGTVVFENLNRMRELVDRYWDNSVTAEEKSFIKAEFNTLRDEADSVIDQSWFNSRKLIQSDSPLVTISIDPQNSNQNIVLRFGAHLIAAPSPLDINGPDQQATAASVQEQLDRAGKYLGEVSGMRATLDAQSSLVRNQRLNYSQLNAQISDTDTAQQMQTAVTWQIRQQSSLAMLGQANMLRGGILALFA